ncbi:hypothetical protein BEN47_01130 [Hymenobacter lapidarius]|uniref:Uncharacterized protein n=1 Tax=Hymenobacter lapidarius TaxID=1908237 RepID=A0A1G1T5Q1_9BACT|nr:hypothetical protein BEN47_01130 [Hymenobacter lapidarius]
MQPRLLALVMVFAGLASGCQSSRPGFSFQPAPGRMRLALAAVPVAVEEPVAAAKAALVAVPVQPRVGVRPRKQLRQLRTPAPAVAVAPVLAEVATSKAVPHRRALLQRPQTTAEAGLGTTVLGVLGLIMLPIALVGLLLSGGLVWGIVAGLAALAVLVAYLDPFGR